MTIAIILPPKEKLGYDPFKKRRKNAYNCTKTRKTFNKLKRTQGFKKWKKWAFSVQRKKCYYCDKRINIDWGKTNYAHTEHRLALSNGGTNDYKNLVLSCPSCNRKKGVGKLRRTTRLINNNRRQRARIGLPAKEYSEG